MDFLHLRRAGGFGHLHRAAADDRAAAGAGAEFGEGHTNRHKQLSLWPAEPFDPLVTIRPAIHKASRPLAS